MTWAAIIDAAAAKWPQTDAMGRTLADDAADLIESRQVRQTRSGAWRVDAAGAAANVAADGSACDCHGRAVHDPIHGRICAHRVAVYMQIKLRRETARLLAAVIAQAAGRRIHLRARVTYAGDVARQGVELVAYRIDGERWTEITDPAPLAMADLQSTLYDARYAVDPAARVVEGRHRAGRELWAIGPMRNPANPGDPAAATRVAGLYGWDEGINREHQFADYTRRAEAMAA